MLTLPSTWSQNGGSVDSVDVDDFLEDGEELASVDPRLVNIIRQVISRGDDHARRLSREFVPCRPNQPDLKHARLFC